MEYLVNGNYIAQKSYFYTDGSITGLNDLVYSKLFPLNYIQSHLCCSKSEKYFGWCKGTIFRALARDGSLFSIDGYNVPIKSSTLDGILSLSYESSIGVYPEGIKDFNNLFNHIRLGTQYRLKVSIKGIYLVENSVRPLKPAQKIPNVLFRKQKLVNSCRQCIGKYLIGYNDDEELFTLLSVRYRMLSYNRRILVSDYTKSIVNRWLVDTILMTAGNLRLQYDIANLELVFVV